MIINNFSNRYNNGLKYISKDTRNYRQHSCSKNCKWHMKKVNIVLTAAKLYG